MASIVLRASIRNATRRIGQSSILKRAPVTISCLSNNLILMTNPIARNDIVDSRSCVASFSSNDDSHSDFAPKRAVIDAEEEAIEMIKVILSKCNDINEKNVILTHLLMFFFSTNQEHVKENPVMLYMKGNPSQPQCGFSARVVQVLQKEGVDFSSVNVLDYPSIREGVKKFSDWPTIPQLYINGEFIGGCDIVMSLHESGELKEILSE